MQRPAPRWIDTDGDCARCSYPIAHSRILAFSHHTNTNYVFVLSSVCVVWDVVGWLVFWGASTVHVLHGITAQQIHLVCASRQQEPARTATVKLCRSRNNNKLFAILPCLLSSEHGAWWLLLLMHLCLFRLASAGPVWCCVFLCSLLSFDF